jgi:predicted enzyme related to lactoylglutathione lyase
LAEFWMGFTGFDASHAGDDWFSIRAPDHSARIGFQKVPEGKIVKNRVHIDFVAQDEDMTARQIEALGATRRWVSEDSVDPFVVLADPEGNEFCIVRDLS